jgi:hypothetical protein
MLKVPEAVLDQLTCEILNRGEAYVELGTLCDTVGGRVAGTEAAKKGEEWAFKLFERWGLACVRFEEFPVLAWTRGTLSAQVVGDHGWTLAAVAHGNAPAHVAAEAEVLDVGHGDTPDYERLGEKVLGKVTLCDEGVAEGRRGLHRTEKLKLAIEAGAAGLMISSSAAGGLSRTGVCHYAEASIPSMGISQEDGSRLQRLLASGRTVRVRIDMQNGVAPGHARNVIAEIPGTDGDEVVLAGGHLDSWDLAQGATDNGLGSAIVLEMARALGKLEKKPRRTMRFALWAAEEVGLCGSHEHVRWHGDALDGYAAVLNFDMTGDPFGYWCPGRPESAELLSGLATQLAGHGIEQRFEHRPGLHSDHQPFMLAGVPVLGLMANLPNEAGRYYHSVGDTFEKVSRAALGRAALAGAATMYALADEPKRSLNRMSDAEVAKMVKEGNLLEALAAEGWRPKAEA